MSTFTPEQVAEINSIITGRILDFYPMPPGLLCLAGGIALFPFTK